MDRPDLSVVVVSHNHAAYLPACLDSLAGDPLAPTLEVFLVDNATGDSSSEIGAARPWVRLIRNPRPRGFAANNNLALRQSRGRYVLLLNPDTAVQPGALTALVDFMDSQPRAGICAPQLVFPDGRVQPSCRRFPTPGSVLARRTPLRRWLWDSRLNQHHLMQDFDHTRVQTVDWLLGACLLVRRAFLETVGLMDEGYFLYVEDIDWARRAWQSGWEVVYYPAARVVHHHLARSDRALLSRYSWLHLQSMWRYYRKHLAPGWLRLKVSEERLPELATAR